MIIYLLTLGITFLLAYFAQGKQRVLEDGVIKKTTKNGKWAIAAVCAILIFIGGFRYFVGSDWGVYKALFGRFVGRPLFDVLGEEEGFFWAIATIVGWFTSDVNVVFLVCEIIIILCFVPTMAKYSHNLSLTVFLYLAMMDYFTAFNGVRQWVAAAITFASLPLLKERKLFRYLLMILFAYCFHNSAIFMIPIGLFALVSPTSKWNIGILGIIGILFFLFPTTLDSILEEVVKDSYTKFIGVEGDDGVHILRVLVALLPPLVARIFYKKLATQEKDKKFVDLLINFSTVNFVVMLLATRSTMMARVGMYASPYNALLIPYFLRIFKNQSRLTAKVIIMALFLVYMVMLLPADSNVLPYRNTFGWYFA